MKWYFLALKNSFTFSGRSRRKEYWYFLLFNVVISILLGIADAVFGLYSASAEIGILGGLYSFLVIVPSIAVSIRRLHDTDRTGWWLLLAFIPVIGPLILLYFFVKGGSTGNNQYGPDPKQWL